MNARIPTRPAKPANEAASTRFALPVNEAGVDELVEVGEEDLTAGLLEGVLPAAVLAGGTTAAEVLPFTPLAGGTTTEGVLACPMLLAGGMITAEPLTAGVLTGGTTTAGELLAGLELTGAGAADVGLGAPEVAL
jgi:hypothetical protein